MKHILFLSLIIPFTISCNRQEVVKSNSDDLTSFLSYDPFTQINFDIYSKIIDDTFNIFISLPKEYKNNDETYPAVYVLDANVSFEMVSILMKLLSNGMDCKQAIYIGVGYKDIIVMDSLRGRDYTFPHKDDFPESGGGEKFSCFLQNELIPKIDSTYRTKSKENTILGHSVSGYFVIYYLLSSAIDDRLVFKNFIAGSPFIGNDQYFIDLEKQLSVKTDSLPVNLFLCSGTIEDTDSMQIVFTNILKQRNYKGLKLKSIIINDFDHMDMLIPTWSKGLRYILSNE